LPGPSGGDETCSTFFRRDGANLIDVQADLDILSSPALLSAVALAANTSPGRIVVDLSACRYCDSSGLGALMKAKKRLGERLAIVGPSRREGRRIFDVVSLSEALPLYATLEEALSIPPRSAGHGGHASA
jgi:anti-anti-sigma factor